LCLESALKTDEIEYRHRTVRGEPQPDDIVLVREGGGTGKAAIVLQGQRFSLGQRVMMLRPDKDRIVPKFFLYQLLSPLIQDDHIAPLSKGSAAPHLNIGSLRKFPFRLPSPDDQRRIVSKLDDLRAEIDALKGLQAQTNAEINSLLSSVLSKAFAGEL
jgi:type I restriction enzyme S subunit